MATPGRGVKDIKTMAAHHGPPGSRPQCCLKLAMLELEKQRRNIERNGLMRRLDSLNVRLHEIDSEAAGLLGDLGPATRPGPSGLQRVRKTGEADSLAGMARPDSAVSIRY